jgi:mono/diheme cytochrome c family protein
VRNWHFTCLVAAMFGCVSPTDETGRFLDDAAFRREALTASLLAPDNAYSVLRLDHYGHDWDELPVWNPTVQSLDETFAPAGDERALELDDPQLGREAFFRYPAQLSATLDHARMATNLAGFGFAVAPTFAGGVVLAKGQDGRWRAALTCASCHARVVDGRVVVGVANQALDLGRLFTAPWPKGQVDVSASADETPVAIPDLRAVAWQANLQAAGAVRNDRIALAIRIETLLITAHGAVVRPPREVALALADFLRALAPPVPQPDGVASRGAALFAERCAGCHMGEGRSGPPVPAATVGTDARVALSADRGTGGYRAPSLLGVADRGALFHDASVQGLDELLDPSRGGGHRFGLDLDDGDRAALRAFLIAQ